MRLISLLFFLAIFIVLPLNNALAVFSIEIPEDFDIYFGQVAPGTVMGNIPNDGFDVVCTSDQGNPWFLELRMDQPLTNEVNAFSVIPLDNFFFYGIGTTGSGVLVTERTRLDTPKTVYTSPAAEGADGVGITLKFRIDIPRIIQSGRYSGQLIFTLTE
jgi:hypothetical protein